MDRDKLILIALIQAIIYSLIWLYDDYVGLILCSAFALITFSVGVISWIADRIEYAKVGTWYYPLLLISFLIPVLITIAFWIFKNGEMNWMKAPF